jgi:hypothetical protein
MAWRNNSISAFDRSSQKYRRKGKWDRNGVPDILGILPDGKFLGIEVKKNEASKPNPDQKKFLAEAGELPAVVFVAWTTKQVRDQLSAYFTRKSFPA